MKQGNSLRNRRGISPVIATIILSAVVITIGGAVWSYAQSAATVIADDYVDGTFSLINEVTERFVVEHAGYDSTGKILSTWVYNYGAVSVTVDVYISGAATGSTLNTVVPIGTLTLIQITGLDIPAGGTIAIKVHSRCGNNVYSHYYRPAA